MYNDIGQFVKKVNNDPLSTYLQRLSFTINGFGRFSQQDISSFCQFFSGDNELILFVRGNSILHTNDGQFLLSPGTLLLLRPFHIYTAICQPGEKLYYYYIHFDVSPPHMTDSYLQTITRGENTLIVPPQTLPDLIPSFASMLEDWRAGKPGLMTLLHSYLYILSVHLARLNHENPLLVRAEGKKISYELDLVSQALDYIVTHLDQPLKLYDISRELGVSSSALYKLFRQILHTSPSDYIAKTRLRQAELLLRSSGCTIAEAARRCGFCNASHLSRQFKNVHGMSPSHFLKENPRDKELVED
ncbi:MAG: helix-turn-helix transcriptional regulator [Lachnospiraceae bacterium]|nr:helix-turn-helix transcriptional regulator [Lachnospiraceae bacterium]